MSLRLLLYILLGATAATEEATRFLQSRALKKQSGAGVDSPSSRNSGGAQLWLSDMALNYVAKELLPQVLRNLTKVPLGSFSGDYKGVKYRLWDVDLNHVGIQKPSMEFRKGEGVRLCLGGIWANVSSDWSAEWYFLSLAGGTSVLVTDGQLCASIELKAAAGRPKVSVENLDVNLELGPVTFTGTSIHWLMNAAAFLFESYLEDLAAKTIKKNVELVVKTNLAESLRDLDLSAKLQLPEANDSVSIDLSLKSITTAANYLQVSVDGMPSVAGEPCPFARKQQTYSQLPGAWNTHMASGTLSDWGINCGIWAVNKTGLLNYKMYPWYIPNNTLGISLYTSFMKILVPGLKTYYHRDYPLELSILPLPTPTFEFESGYLSLVSPILFNFTTLLTKSGNREFCFAFTADVHAKGHLWIEQNPMRLKTNLSLLGASNLKAAGSIAGPIDLYYAKQLLQVLRGPGEKAINDGPLGPAIPLSSNSTFSLENAELSISKGGLYFFSDLAVHFGRHVQEMISRQFNGKP